MASDLKAFVTNSTFVTLAVAFVVGTQVSLVVTALVTDVVMPLVGVVFKTQFSSLGDVTINGSTIYFGGLLGAIITFLIVLVVVFFALVYPIAKYEARKAARAAAAPPTTRACPECCSTINIQATRCAFCTATVPPAPVTPLKAGG
ncbi:MAG: MscL family protein [Thermoplasmata archaeon]